MRIPALALLASLTALSHAGTILGIENNGLYKIDTSTGAATLVASLAGHGTGDVNALAYDSATDNAYFGRNGRLWSVNVTSHVFAQTSYTIGDVAAATFYNRAYVFGTGTQLKKVDFAAPGAAVVGTFNKGWAFGDIASTSTGMLYGSSGASVFSVNLANNAYASLSTAGKNLQLAFVGNALYGVANGNAGLAAGGIYTVNTTTGVESSTGLIAKYNNAALAIRDAATYNPVPEPASVIALTVGAVGVLRRRRAR